MLKPSEFIVGNAADSKGLVLSLGRADYDFDTLLFTQNDRRHGLILSDHRDALHRIFDFDGHTNLNGMLIPNVSILLDETSLTDVSAQYPPVGSLVRKGTELCVHSGYIGGRMLHHGGLFTLLSDLPPCDPNQSACFLKWEIVFGEGDDQRILKQIEVSPHQLG